ncbi:hypothetical protein [Rhodoferax sp.]|uniref:hypothetical protein n=1 Tax=Rhodoferax sp. TaxID=50421 RepID=UPI00261654B1|nr:hypothetical protein [Rhodoferax sp.]MDD2811074.1 hypothetical protein [Rhodoferax sp.]
MTNLLATGIGCQSVDEVHTVGVILNSGASLGSPGFFGDDIAFGSIVGYMRQDGNWVEIKMIPSKFTIDHGNLLVCQLAAVGGGLLLIFS